MSQTGKQKLKGWRESAQKFLTDTLNTNMTPKKRKDIWEVVRYDKENYDKYWYK